MTRLAAWFVWVMLLAGCTAEQVGEAVYRSLEQKKCYDEQRSYGKCQEDSM